jgi:hypothetical protein
VGAARHDAQRALAHLPRSCALLADRREGCTEAVWLAAAQCQIADSRITVVGDRNRCIRAVTDSCPLQVGYWRCKPNVHPWPIPAEAWRGLTRMSRTKSSYGLHSTMARTTLCWMQRLTSGSRLSDNSGR